MESLYVLLRPFAVNASPDSAGILVLQNGRQAFRSNGVVALQHTETQDRCRDSHCRKSRVTSRGKRPAVIHGGTDRDARRHLVIQ